MCCSNSPPLFILDGLAKWSPWGRWGTCSVTCGGGRRIRRRTCVRTSITVQCTGRPVDIQKCGRTPCPGVQSYPVYLFGVFVGLHLCFCAVFTTAKCQRVCTEGRPSEDCSRCVCDGHMLQGDVHSVTGVPVAGASVALASHPKVVSARTDAEGQFRLTGVCSSSSALITIRKEKFVPVTVSTYSNTTGLSWLHAVLRSAGECIEIKTCR